MADRLYLSLWFPNFRLGSLPAAMVLILKEFAEAGGSPRVHAAAVYPLSWSESPFYQRIYKSDEIAESAPEAAVAEATSLLHDDCAYEFEVLWELWVAGSVGGLDPAWTKEQRVVRIAGFGPQFDEGAYLQNGQIRVDFGVDSPFLLEEMELDRVAQERVKQNIQQLIEFSNAVEKHCGIQSRILWSESGENLAQKLIGRLQRVN